MSDEMKDYVDNFRASLPAGITYDSDIARYFCNNRRFFNEWEVERYLNYITKFGFSAFTPATLFASGEQGAWYDPSDLTTLYQDSAGTTPVTADGDPVGRMEDKSGNGNHATQATSASRPVYRTDGTLHRLEFDGVDDLLKTATIDWGATSQMELVAAIKSLDTSGGNNTWIHTQDGVESFRFGIQSPRTSTTHHRMFVNGNTDTLLPVTDAKYAPPDKRVIGASVDFAAGTASLRLDGVEVVGRTSLSSGSFPNAELVIGMLASSGIGEAQIELYGAAIIDRLLTPSERTSAEQFYASKAGITL